MKKLFLYVSIILLSFMLTGVGNAAKAPIERQIGLIKHDPSKTFKGYTLFAPKHGKDTHLIDMEGRVINTWTSNYEPGQAVYLRENGNLLRCCFTRSKLAIGGGEGGRIEEYDWDGNMVWSWDWNNDKVFAHHDIVDMPNGNKNTFTSTCSESFTSGEKIKATITMSYLRADSGLNHTALGELIIKAP